MSNDELMAYITANTGGGASPYVLTQSSTTGTTSFLSAAPAGTKRVSVTVDGTTYSPLVASCPAASCTNGDPIAAAVQDDATKAYLDAVSREVEKDFNVVTAVLGVGGAVVRGVKAADEIISTAVAANNASKTASVATGGKTALGAATDAELTNATNAGANGTYVQKGTGGYGTTTAAESAAAKGVPYVAGANSAGGNAAGRLTYDAVSESWTSPGGLVYGQGSAQGNRVLHVLEHTVPDPSKPVHSVFNVDRTQIIGLVDEAWAARVGSGTLQANGNRVWIVDMGRQVGTGG